jgi:hypothetical protein
MFFFRKPLLIADLQEASYVTYGIEELHRILGPESLIRSCSDPDALASRAGRDCLIYIGRASASIDATAARFIRDIPGPEGYLLRSSFHTDGVLRVVVAGSDPIRISPSARCTAIFIGIIIVHILAGPGRLMIGSSMSIC